MDRLPIIAHHEPRVGGAETDRAAELARRVLSEESRGQVGDPFLRDLVLERQEDGPTLHLDDVSSVALLDRFFDVRFVEDRARLRAGDGDLVATCTEPVDGFAEYCGDRLALGDPEWLRPRPGANALEVATACWTDAEVRNKLLEAVRSAGGLLIHPHMGNDPVWELAYRLRQETGRPVRVIAPPPGLTRRVNDKLWFTSTTARLLGSRYLPRRRRCISPSPRVLYSSRHEAVREYCTAQERCRCVISAAPKCRSVRSSASGRAGYSARGRIRST